MMITKYPKVLKKKSPTVQRTGEALELLLESRIREAVDHAGPSQPLEPWKELIRSTMVLSSANLNRCLSIAQLLIMDVMVAPWSWPSVTYRATTLEEKVTILTMLEMRAANTMLKRESLRTMGTV